MSKLILEVDDALLSAASDEATARDTSVSRLVNDFLRSLTVKSPEDKTAGLAPVTRSLAGCIRGGDDDLESYIDYLEAKHS